MSYVSTERDSWCTECVDTGDPAMWYFKDTKPKCECGNDSKVVLSATGPLELGIPVYVCVDRKCDMCRPVRKSDKKESCTLCGGDM